MHILLHNRLDNFVYFSVLFLLLPVSSSIVLYMLYTPVFSKTCVVVIESAVRFDYFNPVRSKFKNIVSC